MSLGFEVCIMYDGIWVASSFMGLLSTGPQFLRLTKHMNQIGQSYFSLNILGTDFTLVLVISVCSKHGILASLAMVE